MADDAREPVTCWTIVGDASRGDAAAREVFARTYWPVVHDYLSARWRNSPLRAELEDSVQEVFLDCFKTHGALERVERGRDGGFRGFLYGVVRNVALRAERRARSAARVEDAEALASEESALQGDSPTRMFDRAWAMSLLQAAAQRMEARARELTPDAARRVELLRLRFQDALPIREIAELWRLDAALLHHEYARARREFRDALATEVAFHLPGSPDEVERECARLLELIS